VGFPDFMQFVPDDEIQTNENESIDHGPGNWTQKI
jgi:hypothetical protein